MTSPGASDPAPGVPYVLVVEDDPSVQSLLETLLRSEGYSVVAVGDGTAALVTAAGRRPAVVLLDLVMPDLDGLSVLQEMSDSPELCDVPVLVLTGRLEAIAELAERLGPDRVFPKPFGVADLLSRIAELTGKAPTA